MSASGEDGRPGPRWARRAQRQGGLRFRWRDLFEPGLGLVLVPLLIAILAAQYFWLPDFGLSYALSAEALKEGRWWTPFTSMFLHGGVLHLFMNLTAFGSLYAATRLEFGPGLRGHLALSGLYLAAGLAGSLVYLALHPDGSTPVLGASGAICGLWGAASRRGSREGALTPLRDRQVWLNLRNFAIMNLVLVLIVAGPQLLAGGEAQGGIAWEGHVGGFLAGLFLIPLFQRWSGWTPPPPPPPPWWVAEPGPWSRGGRGLSVPPSRPPG